MRDPVTAPYKRLTPEEAIEEIRGRTRRIETRLTKFMEKNGFDTEAKRPVWDRGRQALVIPSLDATLRECLAALPDASIDYEVRIGDDLVGYLGKP